MARVAFARFKEQRLIGWKSFLEGIMSSLWAKYMSFYFSTKKSNKSGKTWAARLLTYSWKFVFYIWEQRNKQLHHTARIKDLEGQPTLINSIQTEWYIGLGLLPASEYSRYFTMHINQILLKPLEWQQTWFQIIRQARILMDSLHLVEDEFTTSTTLQKWVGIYYTMSDEEVLPTLHNTIKNELQVGLGTLPSNIYQQYFLSPYASFIQQNSITNQKSWLVIIRHARETYNTSNLLQDDFSRPGLFRSWLGL